MFSDCKAPTPYWFGNSNEEIVKNIEYYDLFNKIDGELENKNNNIKKMKI